MELIRSNDGGWWDADPAYDHLTMFSDDIIDLAADAELRPCLIDDHLGVEVMPAGLGATIAALIEVAAYDPDWAWVLAAAMSRAVFGDRMIEFPHLTITAEEFHRAMSSTHESVVHA